MVPWMVTLALLVAALMIVPVGFALSDRARATASVQQVPVNGPTCGEYFCLATPIHHIVVIMLENAAAINVLAQAPYMVYLAKTYAYANHSFGACHPSEPNYYAITMGTTAGQCNIGNNSVIPGTGPKNFGNNLGDLLDARGLSWAGFFESMNQPCEIQQNHTGVYDSGHNPFVHFGDIVYNKARCDAHVLNFSAWHQDVANGSIPNFSFVVPNTLDDGHDTSTAWADGWLHHFLPPLLNNTSWAKSTLFIVTYDEGEPGGPPANLQGYYGGMHGNVKIDGGQVYTALISPYTKGEGNFTSNVTEYNLLTTIEWLFSLHDCGNYDDPSQWFPPMAGAFEWTPADNDTIGR
ncbi:MAG: alkaline phosphatase family protein [Thermoplasmata archaeon]|nr:alkaline phosphatase family protein [Thermoplasmata archaeon]